MGYKYIAIKFLFVGLVMVTIIYFHRFAKANNSNPPQRAREREMRLNIIITFDQVINLNSNLALPHLTPTLLTLSLCSSSSRKKEAATIYSCLVCLTFPRSLRSLKAFSHFLSLSLSLLRFFTISLSQSHVRFLATPLSLSLSLSLYGWYIIIIIILLFLLNLPYSKFQLTLFLYPSSLMASQNQLSSIKVLPFPLLKNPNLSLFNFSFSLIYLGLFDFFVGRESPYGWCWRYRLRASQDSRSLWLPRHSYCQFSSILITGFFFFWFWVSSTLTTVYCSRVLVIFAYVHQLIEFFFYVFGSWRVLVIAQGLSCWGFL